MNQPSEPVTGTTPPPEPTAPEPAARSAAPEPAQGPVSHQGAPPPAATVVLTGHRSEKEIELETELEKERRLRREREMRISSLEDENHQLKTVTPRRAPAPKKSGWCLLDTED